MRRSKTSHFWCVRVNDSLYVRESKTVLDSGFHAVDSEFQVLESGFLGGGKWNPVTDSKAKDPGFHKQTFPGFQDQDYLSVTRFTPLFFPSPCFSTAYQMASPRKTIRRVSDSFLLLSQVLGASYLLLFQFHQQCLEPPLQ